MLQADLFNKQSVKDRLYLWLKARKYAKTSDILRWGVENYSNRSDREARKLCEEKKIRRMPDDKKIRYFGLIKEDVWELCDWHTNFKI
jgi:hypothetical protein